MWIYIREKARIAEKIIISSIHYRRAVFTHKQASGFSKTLFNPALSVSNFSVAAKASRDSNAVPHAKSR